MGLKDKVDSLYVAVCGDRITTLGGVFYFIHLYELFKGENSLSNVLTTTITGLLGASLLGITGLGFSTWKHYKRTLKEAQEQGKINVDFFQERIERSENKKLMGYCQIQGLYLGAKKTGNLEEFYQAREMFSNNVIPNF